MLSQQFLIYSKQYQQLTLKIAAEMDRQWVVELLHHSIRQAGFTPCMAIDKLIATDRKSNQPLVAITKDEHLTDGISIQRMNDYFFQVNRIINPTQVLVNGAINPGNEVIIADCFHAEVQRVVKAQPQGSLTLVTFNYPLLYQYHKPYLGDWIKERFFIDTDQHGIKALFYQTQHKEELTPYINQFSVTIDKKLDTIVLLVLGFNQQRTQVVTRVRAC